MVRYFRFLAFIALALGTTAPVIAQEKLNTHYPPMPLFRDYGTDFTLWDHNGQPFTEQYLKGKYSLLYFGYTSCPDVCALALYTVGQAIDALGNSSGDVTPLFINLDEQRTSLPDLKDYVSIFHPSILGLSGSPEELRKVAGAYETRFKAVGAGEDRIIVHSGMMFLVGPNGETLAMLPHDVSVDWLVSTLKDHLPDGQNAPKEP